MRFSGKENGDTIEPMSDLTVAESDLKPVVWKAPFFQKLKWLLERSFPESYDALRVRWYEHTSRQMLEAIGAKYGFVVQSGPFQGMQYLPELLVSKSVTHYALLPKILGCFEEPLHGPLAQVLGRNYSQVVNIGCSEGYYSVGLSLRLPDARVFAFDIDPEARYFCEQMARLNGVQDRIVVGGECTTKCLQALGSSRTLVVCDCEGCELGLLRPDLAPSLSGCDFIVELHDCVDPRISEVVLSRFAHTHDVTVLNTSERNPSTCRGLATLSPYRRRLAVAEYRWGTPCVWSFMTAKHNQQV